MTEKYIVVCVGRKVFVARKRVDYDDHYITIAEVSNEASGEKIVEALDAQAKIQPNP